MNNSFLILPDPAIDQIIFNLDCKSIRILVCTCRFTHNYITSYIKTIFRSIYIDESIRSYLRSIKVKVHNYSQFVKVSRLIEDEIIREYYYYKVLLRC